MGDDHAGFDDEFTGQFLWRINQWNVDRDGHDGEFFRPQHHHGAIIAAIMARRQFTEKFRMAGMRKTSRVKNRFGDGIGDDATRRSLRDTGDGAFDRLDDRRRIRRVRLASDGVCFMR